MNGARKRFHPATRRQRGASSREQFHRLLPWILVVTVVANPGDRMLGAGEGEVPLFSSLPMDFGGIHAIIPLGNLDPTGGHVFPSDHVYFDYGGETNLAVKAPGAGSVYAVRSQIHGGAKVEIRINHDVTYYLGHVVLLPGITNGSRIEAGQMIGRPSGTSMLDLGACDARVMAPGLLNPNRYPEPSVHAISPLALFGTEMRRQLYAKVSRNGGQKDGKFDFDQAGRLAGNWFHQGLSEAEGARGGPGAWAKELAFVYDVHDPGAIRISIGGTLGTPGVYGVEPGDPDPAVVGLDAGLLVYHLSLLGPRNGQPAPAEGAASREPKTLLVQVVGPRRIKVECTFDGSKGGSNRFTSNAVTYER